MWHSGGGSGECVTAWSMHAGRCSASVGHERSSGRGGGHSAQNAGAASADAAADVHGDMHTRIGVTGTLHTHVVPSAQCTRLLVQQLFNSEDVCGGMLWGVIADSGSFFGCMFMRSSMRACTRTPACSSRQNAGVQLR